MDGTEAKELLAAHVEEQRAQLRGELASVPAVPRGSGGRVGDLPLDGLGRDMRTQPTIHDLLRQRADLVIGTSAQSTVVGRQLVSMEILAAIGDWAALGKAAAAAIPERDSWRRRTAGTFHASMRRNVRGGAARVRALDGGEALDDRWRLPHPPYSVGRCVPRRRSPPRSSSRALGRTVGVASVHAAQSTRRPFARSSATMPRRCAGATSRSSPPSPYREESSPSAGTSTRAAARRTRASRWIAPIASGVSGASMTSGQLQVAARDPAARWLVRRSTSPGTLHRGGTPRPGELDLHDPHQVVDGPPRVDGP
jgi:hypothetical protein